MGILLRILGAMWLIGGLGLTLWAVHEAMAMRAPDEEMGALYALGAFIGAGAMLTPVWLTGLVFFLLPGWIRKQLRGSRQDVFS